jgi:hypothetical protein
MSTSSEYPIVDTKALATVVPKRAFLVGRPKISRTICRLPGS